MDRVLSLPSAIKGPLNRLYDFVFGYDYFVAHAWHADHSGHEFARRLVTALEPGLRCFLDSKDFPKGANWTIEGRRALSKTSILILVATPQAFESAAVRDEVNFFVSNKPNNRIIVVDVEGAFSCRPDDDPLVAAIGRVRLRIDEAASLSAGPSPETVAALRGDFDLATQNARRTGILGASVTVLTALVFLVADLAGVAVRAKNAAEEALTRTFLRTIGNTNEFTQPVDEMAALWELSELEVANADVRRKVIQEWMRTADSSLRGFANEGRGLQAAIGLNSSVEAFIALHATAAAEILAAALENPEETNSDRHYRLANALAALAGRMNSKQAMTMADRLAKAMEKAKGNDDSRLQSLEKVLEALAGRMNSDHAAGAADRLAAVLENSGEADESRLSCTIRVLGALTTRITSKQAFSLAGRLATAMESAKADDLNRQSALGHALAALAGRMPSDHARQAAERGEIVLTGTLENAKENDSNQLLALSSAFTELAKYTGDRAAKALSDRLIAALEKGEETGDSRLSMLGSALAAQGQRLNPKEARRGAVVLGAAMQSPMKGDRDRLLKLGIALAALADRMEPKEAGVVASQGAAVLAEEFENAKEAGQFHLLRLGGAFEALSKYVDADGGLLLAERLVKTMENSNRGDFNRLSSMGSALAVLAGRLHPPRAPLIAGRGAAVLVDLLEDTQGPERDCQPLDRAFAALAGCLTPSEAIPLIRRVGSAMDDGKHRLPSLGHALAALAGRVNPADAAPQVINGATALVAAMESSRQNEIYVRASLGHALADLSPYLAPKDASSTALRGAVTLVASLKDPVETSEDLLSNAGSALAALVGRVPTARHTRLFALAHLFISDIQEEKTIAAVCESLTVWELAEVLKWPFCVGSARKWVLAALERKLRRTFDDNVWNFVDQVEPLGIAGLNRAFLNEPAKRPAFADVMTELRKLYALSP